MSMQEGLDDSNTPNSLIAPANTPVSASARQQVYDAAEMIRRDQGESLSKLPRSTPERWRWKTLPVSLKVLSAAFVLVAVAFAVAFIAAAVSGHPVSTHLFVNVFTPVLGTGGIFYWILVSIENEKRVAASERDYRRRYGWVGTFIDTSVEARLAIVVVDTAKQIECHRAWKSDWLDTHRIRLNPAEEVAQTIDGLRRLSEVRRSLGPAPSPDVLHGRPRQVYDRQLAELQTVQDGLVDRIAALRAYLGKLHDLDQLLDAQETMVRSVSVDAQIAELVGRSAQDQLATDSLTGLAGELEFVTQGLRAAIALLDGSPQLPG